MYHLKSISIILFLMQCLLSSHQLPSHLLLDENHIENFESFKSKLNRLQDRGKQFTQNSFSYANEERNENEQDAIFEEFVTLFQRTYVHDKTEYKHRLNIFKVIKSFNRFVVTFSQSEKREDVEGFLTSYKSCKTKGLFTFEYIYGFNCTLVLGV